ncbi:uncharacterized protein BT62DRAFT_920473 [Guyanagaster necrorhizus]|uniref:Uncharacterized protein n=1 Tax=Guyanagaster necrorhizus TaxID=856835 RepID=A0A9P7VSG9_9AGAR|nr:uncharacterized protein BT62DRAFT_920473 [Guyanagaster necrorhizus MCA 3950]KAG7445184.1 hypothetical protein BT62DRAFT_920473 [Guyanagaster necrorhizus MCA 3950]
MDTHVEWQFSSFFFFVAIASLILVKRHNEESSTLSLLSGRLAPEAPHNIEPPWLTERIIQFWHSQTNDSPSVMGMPTLAEVGLASSWMMDIAKGWYSTGYRSIEVVKVEQGIQATQKNEKDPNKDAMIQEEWG